VSTCLFQQRHIHIIKIPPFSIVFPEKQKVSLLACYIWRGMLALVYALYGTNPEHKLQATINKQQAQFVIASIISLKHHTDKFHPYHANDLSAC
jgi:hypothetical protein